MSSTICSRLAAVTVALAAAVALAVATPSASWADGASLPPNNSMFTMYCGCDSDAYLLSTVASTGVSTQLTAGTDIGEPFGASWDDANRVAYVLTDQTNFPVYQVSSAGAISLAFQPNHAGNPMEISAMAINKQGEAFALSGQVFYTMSLTTGALTLVAACDPGDSDIDFLAADPITGDIIGDSYQTGDLWEFNPATGNAIKLGQIPMGDGDAATGLAFDSSGRLWMLINKGGTGTSSELISMDDPVTTAFSTVLASVTDSGLLSNSADSSDYFGYPVFITWPRAAAPATKPTLPTTGVDPEPGAGIGVAFVLVGAIVLQASLRRRKRESGAASRG